jgi:hypothetical protein
VQRVLTDGLGQAGAAAAVEVAAITARGARLVA